MSLWRIEVEFVPAESGPRAEIQQRMERVSILNIFLGKECEQDFTPDALQLVSEGIKMYFVYFVHKWSYKIDIAFR